MREFTKSLVSYSLATSLLGVKQVANLFTPTERDENRSPATKAFDSVTHAATDQLGETLNSAFRMLDNAQRGMVNLGFSFLNPLSSSGQSNQRDSGHSDGTWSSEPQRWSDVMPDMGRDRTAEDQEETVVQMRTRRG